MVYLKNINYLIYKTNEDDHESGSNHNENTECFETYLVGKSCNGDENYRDQCDDKPVTNKVVNSKTVNEVTYYATSLVTADCSQSCYQNETNINCETYFKNTAAEFTVCATSMATCLGCNDTCLELDCVETYLSRGINCDLKEANDNIAALENSLDLIEISDSNVDLSINTSTVDGVTKSVIEADGELTVADITAITTEAGGAVNLKYTLDSAGTEIVVEHNTASNTFTTTASFDSTDTNLTDEEKAEAKTTNAANFVTAAAGNVAVDADYIVELGNYTGVEGATTKVVRRRFYNHNF